MNTILKILAYLSALMGALLFFRPRDSAINTLLWFPKMISGALSPILGITGLLGALLGFFRRDWKLAGVGLLGAGLAARFIADIPVSEAQFSKTFGLDWQARLKPDLQGSAVIGRPSIPQKGIEFTQNLVIGSKPKSGKPFLVDLWQPPPNVPRSGLGIIYAHGSGWRVGDKDMLTQPFFRRLAGDGHVVVDIAYTLYPEADIPTMVREVNQAVLWLKENAEEYGLNPERIVLIGGSAGAHLALLAAYNPGQSEFQPASITGDTSVRGVVAFYPVADILGLYSQIRQDTPEKPRPIDKLASAFIDRIFEVPDKLPEKENGSGLDNYLVDILEGTPDEIPEVYQLCSPIEHIDQACPPTLLIHGSDDVFGLTPHVRRFHQTLQESGVPVIYIEYPHTEHGFDLFLPQISPVAQSETLEVQRFLALLE
jgi:acetyl esterase/lipase/type IV secretory pathway TrbD component